jgi:hypothetical protein
LARAKASINCGRCFLPVPVSTSTNSFTKVEFGVARRW